MTAARPPVSSAEALMVARKSMNHSASPSSGCNAIGLGCGAVIAGHVTGTHREELLPGLFQARYRETGSCAGRNAGWPGIVIAGLAS